MRFRLWGDPAVGESIFESSSVDLFMLFKKARAESPMRGSSAFVPIWFPHLLSVSASAAAVHLRPRRILDWPRSHYPQLVKWYPMPISLAANP